MNKTIIIVVGIFIGLLLGWVIGFYQMKLFFYDPTLANLTQLKETLETTKSAYEEQIKSLKTQKTMTANEEAKLREEIGKYVALNSDLTKQIAEMRMEFNNSNPFLGVAAFGTVLLTGFLLIWLIMEGNDNKKTVERLVTMNPEKIQQLTGCQLPKGKVIDAVSSPPNQKTLPKEQSSIKLPKD